MKILSRQFLIYKVPELSVNADKVCFSMCRHVYKYATCLSFEHDGTHDCTHNVPCYILMCMQVIPPVFPTKYSKVSFDVLQNALCSSLLLSFQNFKPFVCKRRSHILISSKFFPLPPYFILLIDSIYHFYH